MADNGETVTLTLPAKLVAQQHVEHLQSVIARRNEEIQQLTVRLQEAEAGEPNQARLAGAYARGWRDAADRLVNVSSDAARALGKVSKEARDIYSEGRGA